MSLFLSGVTWMNLSLLPFSSYQRLNPQLVHDHPTLQAMSSFNEDIDEGPNLHEELPFWQEELSSSSFSSSSSEDGTKEYERSDGGSVGSDNKIFKARSVSPHTAWRAEVDWQTFIKFGSEARSTNWIGDPFYPKDKSIFELRGKPSSRRFKDTPRRNSMPTVSAAVPGSSPAIPERPSLALRSWEKPWDVFTKALDPAVEYGFNYMRQLTTTRSEESFAVARAWLADCILGHGKEPRPKTNSGPHPAKVRPKVPRRLIDVVNKTGQPGEVSLVQPQLSGIYEYAALTYCWGQVQGATWLTTKANLVSRSAGFIRSSMPQTLQDALIITEKLGLRYVWIDALCIVQDDPEDWEVEGSKMAGIYIGAYVTISASSSISSHSGIFNSRSTIPLWRPEIVHIESELTDGRRSQLYFNTLQPFHYGPLSDVWNGPLSARAWCLQERALSPRIIHYTNSQILWECEHCVKFEDNIERNLNSISTHHSFYKRLTNDFDVRILSAKDISEQWYGSTVPEYAYRMLTNESDKLVAISALAEVIHMNSGEEYIAGLWRSSVLDGLLWTRDGSGAKTKAYRCPSWSWVSQKSGVNWDDHWRDTAWYCELLAVEVKSGKHNDFGSVESGYIQLRTWVMPAWAWRTTTPENPEYVSLFSWDDTRPSNIEAIMDDDDWRVGRVFCALISSRRLMVLQLVDLASHIYKRVGISERLKFSRWDDEMKIEFCEWYGDVIMQHGIRVDITII
ncbi:hypothetical protein PG987_006776 [Apiospora arundinis]